MDGGRVPQHVAIIMDGNGRWAQRRRRPRVYGHIRGASRVRPVLEAATDLGVKVLTLYAFSTENWTRPESERAVLWKLFKKFIRKEEDELDRQGVQFRVMGEVHRLSKELQSEIRRVEERMRKNTGIVLNLAISYGSRRELTEVSRQLALECQAGRLDPHDISEKDLEKFLWTARLGEYSEVDLMIRTSGEVRTSNFLLWQAAYAELVFTDCLWPDFGRAELEAALSEYSKRERRFGGTTSWARKTNSKKGSSPLRSALASLSSS